MDQERFETAIKNAIVSRNAITNSDRNKIYQAARNSVRQRESHTAEMLAALDRAISSIEATFERPAPPQTGRSYRRLLFAVALFAVGVAAGGAFEEFADTRETGDARLKKLETLVSAYDDNVAQVPVAMNFLREVIDEIVKRQASDRASLDAISEAMTPLSKFDPELNGRQPTSLPQGTVVMVRANAYNVKVLMNWPLCGVVSVSNPELVDPVRALPSPTIGCQYFGMWTTGAKRW